MQENLETNDITKKIRTFSTKNPCENIGTTKNKKNYEEMDDVTLLNVIIDEMKKKIYNKDYSCKNRKHLTNKKREYRNKHPEKTKLLEKEWRDRNKESRKLYMKNWRKENKEHKKTYAKKYYINNITHIQTYQKKYLKTYHPIYNQKNKNVISKKRKIKRKIDVNYKISCNLRTRLHHALKGGNKSGSAVRDLGMSIPEFKKYIESRFQEGMSWENYGIYGWHLDHITPLTWFNLENREQFLVACNYTNYQPLWAEDNWSKNRFIIIN